MSLFRRRSTRDLLGIQEIREHTVRTARGERSYFFLTPTNISVLSREGVAGRVQSLMEVLKSLDRAELICMDGSESFAENRDFLRRRYEAEPEPAIRRLLQQDAERFQQLKVQAVTARRFLLAVPMGEGAEHRSRQAMLEALLHEQGFYGRQMTRDEQKELMALWFCRSPAGEPLPDWDGGLVGEKEFLDLIAPAAVQFQRDHYLFGDTYRCAWALRGYPTATEAQALLRFLGERGSVTVHIYTRHVTPFEEDAILTGAANRNRLAMSSEGNVRRTVAADSNLRDVSAVVAEQHRGKAPLLHCAVYLELMADTPEELSRLQAETSADLARCGLQADRLHLCQQQGFHAAQPWGGDVFGTEYERVLPARSAANLYPLHYSGKTDPHGFPIGRDKFGGQVIVDLERRAEDKTTGSALILGNSGQGKTFLLKLLLTNLLEYGKSVICLDPENELMELCQALGGCYVDVMGGAVHINPLEPRIWDTEEPDEGGQVRLGRHISFLRDFFRSYKDFTTQQTDVIELMVSRLYRQWHIRDTRGLAPSDYPVLADLYAVMEEASQKYDQETDPIYPIEALREVMLGLHSMCLGADARFYNGPTNITSHRLLIFGVKDLLSAGVSTKNALLFSILSLISDRILTAGNSIAILDELHIWLSNPIAIHYIRDMLKRARKRDSSLILASQNLNDFLLAGVAELTKPLFAIPTHQFLFHPGSIDKGLFMDHLQLEESEYALIRQARRWECLYRCGGERFFLQVEAPEYKKAIFGTGGGR